ncbi:hypothetical protein [Micromonospora sp. NPDC051141]|uniref:hypothetical protein n=1 Tax=Micromonospora sp. NPDC051141 TaxID=3364284 RepID=UPI0037B9B0E4
MRMRWAVLAVLVLVGIWLVPTGPAHAAPAETGRYYVVGPPVDGQREYLYAIALRTLGNGNRYREIVDLNTGRAQPDGETFTDGLVLNPGWVLVLPRDAKGQGVRIGPLPRTRTRSAPPATRSPDPAPSTPARTTAPPSRVPPSTRAPATTRAATRAPVATEVAAPPPGGGRTSTGGVDPMVIRVGAGVLSVLLAAVAIMLLRPRRAARGVSLAGDDGPWPPERHHTPAPGDRIAIAPGDGGTPASGGPVTPVSGDGVTPASGRPVTPVSGGRVTATAGDRVASEPAAAGGAAAADDAATAVRRPVGDPPGSPPAVAPDQPAGRSGSITTNSLASPARKATKAGTGRSRSAPSPAPPAGPPAAGAAPPATPPASGAADAPKPRPAPSTASPALRPAASPETATGPGTGPTDNDTKAGPTDTATGTGSTDTSTRTGPAGPAAGTGTGSAGTGTTSDVPRPPLPAADEAPYLTADLETDVGPARVRLVGVAAGRGVPPYAWLGPGETAPPAVLPLVLGRRGPWRLHVDLARVPDVFTLVGPAAVCGRAAATLAGRLSDAGVGVAVVGEALGAELPDGYRRLAGLPEPPRPGEDLPAPSVVFTAGPSPAGARGLAAATDGRCVPVVLGPVPAGRWSLQFEVAAGPVGAD